MANKDELIQEAIDAIVNFDAAAAEDVATRALAAGMAPGEIINEGFVVGISQIGDSFESGEVFLPELMLAAQAMDAATRVCNAALVGGEGEKKGTVIVGTVQGDVHDIGKAIVIAYLKANSYEVYDLGRDCALETFLAKAAEHHAQVIGMSALLTTTMEEQKKLIAALKERGAREKYKIIVGGAPCTQRWADQIGADAYAEDASDGVKKIDALLGH